MSLFECLGRHRSYENSFEFIFISTMRCVQIMEFRLTIPSSVAYDSVPYRSTSFVYVKTDRHTARTHRSIRRKNVDESAFRRNGCAQRLLEILSRTHYCILNSQNVFNLALNWRRNHIWSWDRLMELHFISFKSNFHGNFQMSEFFLCCFLRYGICHSMVRACVEHFSRSQRYVLYKENEHWQLNANGL